jgi:3-oxoacyl-[acyl-carrier protein] reductase
MKLENDIALVTGASRGIGLSIAKGLAAAGAFVVGTATTERGAEHIRQRLNEAGLKGAALPLDVHSPGQIDEVFDTLHKSHGDITILVNNVGITRDNLTVRMKEEEWDEILDVNLRSVFRLCKAALRGMMKARYGRIINVSSVVGVMGNAGQVNYAASKAGMIGFSKSLAREVASRNITVNCIAPGFIDTDMTRALPESIHSALLAQIPLNRLGRAEEVAAAAVFLASQEAGYITGTTLHVNGGLYMN